MPFRTNTLLDVTNQNGAKPTVWFRVNRDGRTHRAVTVEISAGTAEVNIRGRNDQGNGVVIKNVTQTEGVEAAHFPMMGVEVVSAAGARIKVTIDGVCLQVS